MYENERVLYEFMLGNLLLIARDIPEEAMRQSPYPGANPPVWIIGHLAVCTDYAGKILGLERACPREWHARFAPGTNPADLTDPLPTKVELIDALKRGHARVTEALPNADPAVLSQPHEFEILRRAPVKTLGEVLAHLISTHEAFHVAQLSACRRGLGHAPLF